MTQSRARDISVTFYGRLVELAGARTLTSASTDQLVTVGDLRQALAATHPALASSLMSGTIRALIDDRVVGDDQPLAGTSEIAFFPPVSGG